jgi:hypothetical protein
MPFSPTSRYYLIDTAVYETATGEQIRYLRRRFVPMPERFAMLQEHMVTEGDPEQFWQICDANRAMRPEDLTDEVGNRLRITLPAGIPGLSNV